MSRVQEFLRARAGGGNRVPKPVQDAQAEREATVEGPRAASAAAKDFSQVRVHTDAEAAGAADALGARAFASGNDVFVGSDPLTPPLLAHELGHLGQQAQLGPAVQFQPKGGKAGIGATPPEEDFIKDPDNWGAEDSNVLFDQDQALPAADDKALGAFAAAQKEPVYVHLHGYASKEGPTEYNLNLSAHRAIAVKHLLEKLLPAGSKVYVFAHGESKHFGATEKNRRVGISLIGPVEPPFRLPGGGLHYTRGAAPTGPYLVPPMVSPPGVTSVPGVTSDPGPLAPYWSAPTPFPTLPPLSTPRHLMDNAGLLAPSAAHGVSPSTTGNVVDQWDTSYWKYHNLGVPDEYRVLWGLVDLGAGALANKEVTSSIQAYHERNDPTIIEKSNAEVGVHILTTPNLLELGSKKKKDKDRK